MCAKTFYCFNTFGYKAPEILLSSSGTIYLRDDNLMHYLGATGIFLKRDEPY